MPQAALPGSEPPARWPCTAGTSSSTAHLCELSGERDGQAILLQLAPQLVHARPRVRAHRQHLRSGRPRQRSRQCSHKLSGHSNRSGQQQTPPACCSPAQTVLLPHSALPGPPSRRAPTVGDHPRRRLRWKCMVLLNCAAALAAAARVGPSALFTATMSATSVMPRLMTYRSGGGHRQRVNIERLLIRIGSAQRFGEVLPSGVGPSSGRWLWRAPAARRRPLGA